MLFSFSFFSFFFLVLRHMRYLFIDSRRVCCAYLRLCLYADDTPFEASRE